MPFGIPELAAAVRQFMNDNVPGSIALRVSIYIAGSVEPLSLPVSPSVQATTTSIISTEHADVFVPDAFQQGVLVALEGQALRTDALAAALGGDRSRLFKKPKGGLQELREQGLVSHHPRLGYYRPDAPPEELV